MQAKTSLLLSPVSRYFASVAAGVAAPAVLIVLFSLVMRGGFPPAAALLETMPLSLVLALMAAGFWCVTLRESRTTAWSMTSLFPAGALFVVEYCSESFLHAVHGDIDWRIVLFMSVYGLALGLGTAATAHWLSKIASRPATQK